MRLTSLTVLLLLLLILSAITPVAFAQQRPNVIFIAADDQRADTIGALGNPFIQTPNLDRLYGRGFSFLNSYNMGGSSPAVCMPSRAMFMTGRATGNFWESKVGQTLEGIPTMPEAFRAAGYHTHMVGKWHNGDASLVRSFVSGEKIRKNGPLDQEPYQTGWQNLQDGLLEDVKNDGRHHTTHIGNAACDFIYEHEQDKPFFMYVAFFAPHDPRIVPQRYSDRYRDKDGRSRIPAPVNFTPTHPFDQGDSLVRDEKLLPFPRQATAVQSELAEYYGMITQVDEEVGRIEDALRTKGLLDNTIIVYTSDHGLALGSHGLVGKQNLYEHSAKPVPIVFAGPGIKHGSTESFAYLMDIFPTLADMSGVDLLADVDGKSLKPIIDGSKNQVNESIYGCYRQYQRMVRHKNWKLIYYPHLEKTQLFNLEEDPHEMNDLADAPDQKRRIEEMMQRLRDLEKRYNPNAGLFE